MKSHSFVNFVKIVGKWQQFFLTRIPLPSYLPSIAYESESQQQKTRKFFSHLFDLRRFFVVKDRFLNVYDHVLKHKKLIYCISTLFIISNTT